eukprot:SAG11_NODE_102_length_16709_cov_31.066093_13_plen_70_part_00
MSSWVSSPTLLCISARPAASDVCSSDICCRKSLCASFSSQRAGFGIVSTKISVGASPASRAGYRNFNLG